MRLFIFLLFTSSLVFADGKLLFALQSNFYENTMAAEQGKDGPMLPGIYHVDDVILTTNLSRSSRGAYTTLGDRRDGYLTVALKNPVNDWSVTVDVSYGLDSSCSTGLNHNIRITSLNGETLYINTKTCTITVQNNDFNPKALLKDKPLAYNIKTFNNDIIFMLNGSELLKMPKGQFDKLKSVSLDLGAGYNSNYPSFLRDVTIHER